MSIKIKLFTMVSLLATMTFVGACATQSETTAPSSQHPEAQSEKLSSAAVKDEHDEIVELSAVNLTEGQKLKVVATTNIVADLVHNIGGDMIELTSLLPRGTDPHTFNPTPQDIIAVADSHVIFVNGLNLEEFLEKLIDNAAGQAPVVAIAANVIAHDMKTVEGQTHGANDEHDHEGVDPHVWMTPANAIIMGQTIVQSLSQLDPANAESYQAQAKAYTAQLEALETWVKGQIETIPAEKRIMITDHDAFGYYADRYGLDIVGTVIPAYSTNAEPSAQELVKLQQQITKFGVQAVFVGTTVNPVLAERISEDTGIKLVTLYTGALDEPAGGVGSYLDFIRYNTTAIVEALK